MVAAAAGLKAGAVMAKTLASSYGAKAATGAALNSFYGAHIDRLKASDNETMSRTGRVLEAAVFGYGIGYVAPVAIIAAGHLILGNPLAAIGAVGSAVVLNNPLAATCAAMGALYYGYQALNADERESLLGQLQDGLAIGRELVVSIIGFAERTLNALLDNELLKSLKAFVVEYAGQFGRNLAQITRSVGDAAVLAAHRASALAHDAAQSVGSTIYDAAAGARAAASTATQSVHQHSLAGVEWMADAVTGVQDRLGAVAAWLRQARAGKDSTPADGPEPDDGRV